MHTGAVTSRPCRSCTTWWRPRRDTRPVFDLSTVLTLGAGPSGILVGGTTTLTATLKVVDADAYGRLGGNPVSRRTITLQRRAPGAATWTTVGTMPAASSHDRDVHAGPAPVRRRGIPGRVRDSDDEGLNGDASPTVHVYVSTCSGAAAAAPRIDSPCLCDLPRRRPADRSPAPERARDPRDRHRHGLLVERTRRNGRDRPLGGLDRHARRRRPPRRRRPRPRRPPRPQRPIRAWRPPPLRPRPSRSRVVVRVTGQLGSYTWIDGGSDSPWLPGTSTHRRGW